MPFPIPPSTGDQQLQGRLGRVENEDESVADKSSLGRSEDKRKAEGCKKIGTGVFCTYQSQPQRDLPAR